MAFDFKPLRRLTITTLVASVWLGFGAVRVHAQASTLNGEGTASVSLAFVAYKADAHPASATHDLRRYPREISLPQSSVARQMMTPSEKIRYGAHKAYLSSGTYIKSTLDAAVIALGTSNPPTKTTADKFADLPSRFARSYATASTSRLFGSGIYPALFKQDPRYYPSPKRDFASRLLYASSRAVLTRGDNGHTQLNWSRFAGHLTSASLANIYERDTPTARDSFGNVTAYHRRVGVAPTARRFATATAYDALGFVVFDEFDLDGKLAKWAGKVLRH